MVTPTVVAPLPVLQVVVGVVEEDHHSYYLAKDYLATAMLGMK
jgi:hypothetical protein